MQQQQQQLEHMQMLQSLPNPQVLQGQIGQMMMMLQNPQLRSSPFSYLYCSFNLKRVLDRPG